MSILLHLSIILGSLPGLAPAQSSTPESRPASDNKEVTAAAQTEDRWRRVRVPIRKGQISTLELCRGAFDAYGMDGKHLVFKDRHLRVDTLTSRLLLYGLEKSLSGRIAFEQKDGGKTFELAIQKGSISGGRRAAKRKLLKALSRWTGEDLSHDSMGGLLCRSLIEDPTLYPTQVKAVAFLGTPHHGSDLSAYRSLLDLRDNARGRFTSKALLDSWRDGFGEAGHDPWPCSAYLKHLEEFARNPQVRYLNILGNRAPFDRKSLDHMTENAERHLRTQATGRILLPKIHNALSDLRELEDIRETAPWPLSAATSKVSPRKFCLSTMPPSSSSRA